MVSIIDSSSALSCLTKLFSIVKSSANPKDLFFHFLVMPTVTPFSMSKWSHSLHCFVPEVQTETKLWNSSSFPALKVLRNTQFEKDVIFARIYLPTIFNDVDRFLYLDNDIVVTCDVQEVVNTALLSVLVQAVDQTSSLMSSSNSNSASALPSTKGKLPAHTHHSKPAHTRSESAQLVAQGQLRPGDVIHHRRRLLVRRRYAPLGFVFETHPQYKEYIRSNLNISHPLVSSAVAIHGETNFLNGGVILFDAALWRREGWTRRAESILASNFDGSIYGVSVGDQGLFYVLLQDQVAYLPARFNLRRLPKKTVHMLEDGKTTGIIHFAGTTGGDAERLCQDPLQYPLFSAAVMPLYLSVVHAFNSSKCPENESEVFRFSSLCSDAITSLADHLKKNNVIVNYNPGLSSMLLWKS